MHEVSMDFDLDLSIDVLARTPATLRVLLGGLTEPWDARHRGAGHIQPVRRRRAPD
jgi:hypothetical protein